MGTFIAALRKASGMTQKELAEKLNVSDKSVSRWERDDGAPDLSVIPVIAEIFGVTCDELLRGQRMPDAQPEMVTVKGEKERRRILSVGLSRFRSRTLIAVGIAVVGLIAAMIGNLAFLRAYIGFFAGAVFFVAAAVCQAIFLNSALLSVGDDCLNEAEAAAFHSQVISISKLAFGVILCVFAATLPLMVFVDDAYWGLGGGDWLRLGLLFATGAALLWSAVCYFGKWLLVKKGIIAMDEPARQKYRRNRKLLLRCGAWLLAIACGTVMVQALVNNRFSAWNIAGGEEFSDYNSFREYMERPQESIGNGDDSVVMEPSDEVTYYDAQGNVITEDEFYRDEVIVPDGTPEGKVVCTFIWRNQNVCFYRTANTEDGLPITAVTFAHNRTANRIVDTYNIAFGVVYLLELLGTLVIYHRKRAR